MDQPIRVLNAWSRTGDVIAPLLEREGCRVDLVRVDNPEGAAMAASAEPFDLCVAEMAHAGGGAAVLDAVASVPNPPSGIFVNASPLGLRHGVAVHARAGLTLPFRLVDVLELTLATIALHRDDPPQYPLSPLSDLVSDPEEFGALAGPSVAIDRSRCKIARRASDRAPVQLVGGCRATQMASARLLHRLSGAHRFCAIGPGDDVLAAWQLTQQGTLFVRDLERWSGADLRCLKRCVEREGGVGPRLVSTFEEPASLPNLIRSWLTGRAPVALPELSERRADLFALAESELCRGNRPGWLTGVEMSRLLRADWAGLGLTDLVSRLRPSERPAGRSAA